MSRTWKAMQDFMRAVIATEALSQDDVSMDYFSNLNTLLDFQRKFLIGVETQKLTALGTTTMGSLVCEELR